MIVFATLAAALVLFAWGRIRYDVVALMALLAVTLTGIVGTDQAFAGFGHPAVITVAAVLIISRALRDSGMIDLITEYIKPFTKAPETHITSMSGVVALASGFMNNVGAMAILLPVALQTAKERSRSPAVILMPLAFASILGGLITLIGTPPNIIIATYRDGALGEPFSMFDFSYVGAPVALAGVIFIALIGWRLIPKERRGHKPPEELFEIEHYLIEARVPKDNALIGKPLHEIDRESGADVILSGFVPHDGESVREPHAWHMVEEGDVLLLRADPTELKPFIDKHGLEIVYEGVRERERLEPGSTRLFECVIMPGSPLEGRAPSFVSWRSGYNFRVVALGRSGERKQKRLSHELIQVGDVLLLQGHENAESDTLSNMGLLPLPERDLQLGTPRKVKRAVGVFAVAIGLTAAGIVPIAVAFLGVVVAYVLMNVLSVRDLYRSIDWPIIVLLGAMIPVGTALETTGGTALLAGGLLSFTEGIAPWILLTIILVVTMFLSDVINNAATALVMAPIGVEVANRLDANADAFLMAVAIGASCAFLTPIGHQSNTLVMGPGGYRFGDYWRVGLPLEALIVAVAVPLILIFWGL